MCAPSAAYRCVCEAAGSGVEVAAGVKADAYGHGAVETARVLCASGARWLAVATVAEGVELRRAGLDPRILVMGGFLPFEAEAVVFPRVENGGMAKYDQSRS